jgi:ubiquinone/menaquinone biosynthesis C-methylase UbiE
MADARENRERVNEQYADSANLRARIELHRRFSTNKQPWYAWVFEQFDLPSHCRILELGCGTGALWRDMSRRVPSGWEITLSDLSPGMLADAERNLDQAGWVFSFLAADAQAIPFDDASVDAVVANHMLHHVPDVDQALAEIRRILRPGGRLYATTNGLDHMRELRELVGMVRTTRCLGDRSRSTSFSLEHGAGSLEKHFANVVQHRYDNALAVTEIEPLVAYVLSLGAGKYAVSQEKLATVQRVATERITSAGAMRLTSCSGMFLADGPRARQRDAQPFPV